VRRLAICNNCYCSSQHQGSAGLWSVVVVIVADSDQHEEAVGLRSVMVVVAVVSTRCRRLTGQNNVITLTAWCPDLQGSP
jgi:hypothetical protein